MKKVIDMIAGLPGTGIGGLLYLIIAIIMPFKELYRKLRNKSSHIHGRAIRKHMLLTVGVIASMWVMGWLISVVIQMSGLVATSGAKSSAVLSGNILALTPFVITIAALIFVQLSVYVLRFAVELDEKHKKNIAIKNKEIIQKV